MHFRHVAVAVLALMVLLSGCSAFDGSLPGESSTGAETEGPADDLESNGTDGDTENETDGDDGGNETDGGADENAANETETEAEESAGEDDSDESTDETETETEDETDTTSEETWSPPQQPNRPMEDEREDRIYDVTFVNKTPANSTEGYANFDLEVVADTRMEEVDPPEHGDVEGEPYFFVKINDEEDKIVERTGEVRMEENGTFHIPVRPAGIEEYGEGRLTVEVFLMDKDKDWDDIYASWGGTIHFNPDASGDGSSADADTNDSSTVNDSS
ncbi:hypothetical protein [Halomontanus rarus]|uniref:hypothetical protein n=1 Tax=Halomontanus rarus TaxID=3034020 RepID=UPI0023E7F066|nr:hypothetical protein [Halovivax sp. TS33]